MLVLDLPCFNLDNILLVPENGSRFVTFSQADDDRVKDLVFQLVVVPEAVYEFQKRSHVLLVAAGYDQLLEKCQSSGPRLGVVEMAKRQNRLETVTVTENICVLTVSIQKLDQNTHDVFAWRQKVERIIEMQKGLLVVRTSTEFSLNPTRVKSEGATRTLS